MRILVDTNVFLDFLLENPGLESSAKAFFVEARRIKAQLIVTSMTLRDAGYIAHHRLHDKWKSRDIQISIYGMAYKVASISVDAAISALYDDRQDYEDSLIIEAAEENMCDYIVTRNIKDFAKSAVPAINTDDMAALMRNL